MVAHMLRLEVVEGSQKGQRFGLEPGTYRVLGRQNSGPDSTQQLTRSGDRALDPDRQEIVDRVVGKPGGNQPRVRTGNRRRAADLDLQDDGVSRTHAMVFLDEDGNASVVDLMSTNGTELNGAQVQDADMQLGDIIRLGGVSLRLVNT